MGQRDSQRWRMVYKDGVWWYWTPQNTWLIWTGTRWVAYSAIGYVDDYAAEYRGHWPAGTYSPNRVNTRRPNIDDPYFDQGFLERAYRGGLRGFPGGMMNNPNMPQPGTGYPMPSQTGGPGGD